MASVQEAECLKDMLCHFHSIGNYSSLEDSSCLLLLVLCAIHDLNTVTYFEALSNQG